MCIHHDDRNCSSYKDFQDWCIECVEDWYDSLDEMYNEDEVDEED